jgi:hypothetical protein
MAQTHNSRVADRMQHLPAFLPETEVQWRPARDTSNNIRATTRPPRLYSPDTFAKWTCSASLPALSRFLRFTNSVIGYLNDVNSSPKECQQCTIEVSNLQGLLTNLRYRLEQAQAGDPWYTAFRALNVESGPLDQYKDALEQLRTKVDVSDSAKTPRRRPVWKFTKGELIKILESMKRLKSFYKPRARGGSFVSHFTMQY